ncbi:hypothetical protein LCGC14_2900300 [marine sediment metagenome]|uniref:Uncharacterized protein n=1 Tax=marine sediment metagenome TaxID=412755 RepID=A0A0F8XUZ5_9ZZZZ
MDVIFDLKEITARQMGAFLKAISDNDMEAMAETLTIIVTECPAAWGSPGDVDTFANLSFYGEFQDVINAFTEESKKYTS